MLTYAIIPARSGSKGLPDKNIRDLAGRPLIAYSIAFAKAIGVDKVIVSTDSEVYAKLARGFGAEVPFLRSVESAADTAMEQDILHDMADKFKENGMETPDLLVWLRPTFPFRDVKAVRECIAALREDPNYTAARTVCESESRLYSLDDGALSPSFDDGGKSMMRRQEIGKRYKVFSTDVIRFNPDNITDDFLGRNIFGVEVNKFCGLDIDDLEDFQVIEAILKGAPHLVENLVFDYHL